MNVYLIRHAESENNARPIYDRVADPAITQRGLLQADYLATWMAGLRQSLLVCSPFLRALQTTRAITQKMLSSISNLDSGADFSMRWPRLEVWADVFESGGCFEGHEPANYRGVSGLGRSKILEFWREAHSEDFVQRRVSPASKRIATSGLAEQIPSINWANPAIDTEITEQGWWPNSYRESHDESAARATKVNQRLVQLLESTDFSSSDSAGATDCYPIRVVAIVLHADFKRALLTAMLGDSLDVQSIGPIPNTAVSHLRRADGRWQLCGLNSVTHLPSRLVDFARSSFG